MAGGFFGDFFPQPLQPPESFFSGKSAHWEAPERGGGGAPPRLCLHRAPGVWGHGRNPGGRGGLGAGSVSLEKRDWLFRKGSSLGAAPGWKRSCFGGWAVVWGSRIWFGGAELGICFGGTRILFGEEGSAGKAEIWFGGGDVIWGAGVWFGEQECELHPRARNLKVEMEE